MSITATPRHPSIAGALAAPHWLSRLTARLENARSAVNHAHSQRCTYDQQPDAAFLDGGLGRDDAVGIGKHHAALPFFLQSGFGKR